MIPNFESIIETCGTWSRCITWCNRDFDETACKQLGRGECRKTGYRKHLVFEKKDLKDLKERELTGLYSDIE